MNIYAMKLMSNAEEYVKLSGDLKRLRDPCIKGELQFLDHKKETFGITDEGGLEIPDVIYADGVFMFSQRFRAALDDSGCDYIFYKDAEIVSEAFGIHEDLSIAVVPRIDCLDLDESVLDANWDVMSGLVPYLDFEKLRIMPAMLGRYDIFRIFGISDNNIYITQRMYDILSSVSPDGVMFNRIQ